MNRTEPDVALVFRSGHFERAQYSAQIDILASRFVQYSQDSDMIPYSSSVSNLLGTHFVVVLC
jgi:hypothetical protein